MTDERRALVGAHLDDLEDRVREWLAERGEPEGLDDGESFRVIDLCR